MITALVVVCVMGVGGLIGGLVVWWRGGHDEKVIDDFSYDVSTSPPGRKVFHEAFAPPATFTPPTTPPIDVPALITQLMAAESSRLDQFARLVTQVTESVGQTIAGPLTRLPAAPDNAMSAPVPFYATPEGTEEMSWDPMDELVKRSREFGAVIGSPSDDDDPNRHWSGIPGMVEK